MVKYVLLSILFVSLASCGDSNDDAMNSNRVSDASMSPDTSQQNGPDTYVVGLEKTGEESVFALRLADSMPSPRDTGRYTWLVTLVDADGQPVSGATIQAEPTMPAHGHGTNPKYTDATETDDSGTYELREMDLFMEGVWNIMIRISTEDGRQDRIEYNFYLEG
jgi:hypothetical protein